MLFDYSKTGIDAEARAALIGLAEVSGVAEKRAAMFGGAKINDTEGRAVLHVALRAGDAAQITVDGADVMPGVRAVRARMAAFAATSVPAPSRGRAGRITDVVNIGIGGSDLGPPWRRSPLRPSTTGRASTTSRTSTARMSPTR